MFAIELNYFKAAHNLKQEDNLIDEWEDSKFDYNYLGLNLKYFFPVLILHPYVTFGYGYYTADIFEIGEDTNKGFNFGIGLEVQFGKHFSLLAEGKYHHANLDIEEQELKVRDYALAGGFNFYF